MSHWFPCLRQTASQYSLPDPLQILVSPPPKLQFKAKVKSAINDFWHVTLVRQAASLPSLFYFRLPFLPLGAGSHPVCWTCGSSSSAVWAANVQAKMLSGRYRSCWLHRHWTGESELWLWFRGFHQKCQHNWLWRNSHLLPARVDQEIQLSWQRGRKFLWIEIPKTLRHCLIKYGKK